MGDWVLWVRIWTNNYLDNENDNGIVILVGVMMLCGGRARRSTVDSIDGG